ncbi:MAG: hypothetical protein FD157_3372 [Rhodocyclaceae bacterium]|nr:MAG: hypothetical protein FD157_3372 [Rhodocyclaceae bacterium]TND03515.1 MAG: hypothetical protein FD118_1334 [Rhodocyclaceae bacterium]
MFTIGKLFSHKPDHPMNSVAAARDLLNALDESKPAAALIEIATWADSLAGTDGFACDDRFLIVAEIESNGNRVAADVFQEYLRHIHKRDQEQRKLYEALHTYWSDVAAAYERCILDHEAGAPGAARFTSHLAVAIARAIRASEHAERMSQLRYIGSGPELWKSPCRLFAYAEKMEVDHVSIVVHGREVHSTIRAELLRMAGMSLAALHELPPEQVELAGRILERFAVSFSWSAEALPDCNFVIDLAAGTPPRQRSPDEAPSPGKRFFGGGPALPKLVDIEGLVEKNLLAEEARFGPEFSQAQIFSVIRHLLIYLGAEPPQRRFARTAVTAPVAIIHGFASISPRVTILDAGSAATIDDDLNVEQRKRSGVQLAAEVPEEAPETWTMCDRSEWGLGVEIPQRPGSWAEPGVLCGVRENEASPWLVGIIRSVETSEFGRMHCGLWIMSKRPIATHLRVIGNETNKASNWETSSGGFKYSYLRALLLPDGVKAHERPVMLIERQAIWIGELYEIMAGEHTRHVRLMELIEEGADYMRVGFAWVTPGAS